MQILAGAIIALGIFILGRAYEAHRLRFSWHRAEEEWADLAKEKAKWLSEHSQCAAVLKRKWCLCGMPVKKGSIEDFCPHCRMNIKRRRKRERERSKNGRKDGK
jgi:hypothetical protein